MSITFLSNYTGTWEPIGWLNITEVYTGFYYKLASEFDIFGYSYFWRVNVTQNNTYTMSDIYKLSTNQSIDCINGSIDVETGINAYFSNLSFNSDQFGLIILVLLLSVFGYLGEKSQKSEYLKRGGYFLTNGILLLFGIAYFADKTLWFIPLALGVLCMLYWIRAGVNLGKARKSKLI
jgi:hypothetical protein